MLLPVKQVSKDTLAILDPRLLAIQRKFIYLWGEIGDKPETIAAVMHDLDRLATSHILQAASTPLDARG